MYLDAPVYICGASRGKRRSSPGGGWKLSAGVAMGYRGSKRLQARSGVGGDREAREDTPFTPRLPL
jgi:hypothetical protein